MRSPGHKDAGWAASASEPAARALLERQIQALFVKRRLTRQLEDLSRQLMELNRLIEQLRAQLEALELGGTLRRL